MPISPPPASKFYSVENFDANRILALSDSFKLLCCTDDGGAITVTVPPQTNVAFQNGVQISFAMIGTSTLTLVAGSGVTINSPSGTLQVAGQFGIVTIIQDDPANPDTWIVSGFLLP